MIRAQDLILGAFGGEVEEMGHLRDLLIGANLSPLEQIWDNVEERVQSAGERRRQAREFRRRLREAGSRLR